MNNNIEKSDFLGVKCSNCGRIHKIVNPHKAGTFKLKCKGCDNDIVVKIPEISGAPQVKIECPVCHTIFGGPHPQAGGKAEAECPNCHTKVGYKGSESAAPKEPKRKTQPVEQMGQEGEGVLVVVGQLFKKKFALKDGDNVVGRNDAETPSDIMVDDRYVSRRSVVITKVRKTKGSTYTLEVKKCTNSVLLNGQKLYAEDKVGLNYGDIIVLGETKLRFEKSK